MLCNQIRLSTTCTNYSRVWKCFTSDLLWWYNLWVFNQLALLFGAVIFLCSSYRHTYIYGPCSTKTELCSIRCSAHRHVFFNTRETSCTYHHHHLYYVMTDQWQENKTVHYQPVYLYNLFAALSSHSSCGNMVNSKLSPPHLLWMIEEQKMALQTSLFTCHLLHIALAM